MTISRRIAHSTTAEWPKTCRLRQQQQTPIFKLHMTHYKYQYVALFLIHSSSDTTFISFFLHSLFSNMNHAIGLLCRDNWLECEAGGGKSVRTEWNIDERNIYFRMLICRQWRSFFLSEFQLNRVTETLEIEKKRKEKWNLNKGIFNLMIIDQLQLVSSRLCNVLCNVTKQESNYWTWKAGERFGLDKGIESHVGGLTERTFFYILSNRAGLNWVELLKRFVDNF